MDILVAGGTSGIGKAIVEQMKSKDNRIFVISRNEPENRLEDVEYIQGDVMNDLTLPDMEKLDAFVYCPGSINLKPFNRLKEDEFRSDFDINVIGAVRMLQKVQPLLKKSENASVLLFSTVAVSQGMPYHASTAAAKAAVEGLVRSLAAEWAPHVRVNAIAPSITDTPMAERLLSSDERRENSAKRHPMNRVGQPEDIASIAKFLISPSSSWITGQVIGVDGGMSTLRGL